MFILTDKKTGGIYAVRNKDHENTVTIFEEEDDAQRYIDLLDADDYEDSLETMEVELEVVVINCNTYGYSYSIIEKDDLIVPP
ncbi:hypothetical protein [Synechococcus phage S-RS29]|nr:hypothetical protein [Synechococcus phage S-RS29]|tara:strand:+ start:2008 stop:2256 length:249 start_codon:yes stop_codon:yes gene_type:complete